MYAPIPKIDAHVHLTSLLFAQELFQPKEDLRENECVKTCFQRMSEHGVEQCLAIPAQGLSIPHLENPLLIKMAETFPDRIAGTMVAFSQPQDTPWEYDSDAAAQEVDGYLKNPIVKGLGELAIESIGYMAEWSQVWPRLRPVFDVLAAHNAPCLFHTGAAPHFSAPGQQGRTRSRRSLYYSNPALIDDIAEEYPDVPIIIGHAGIQGFFYYGGYADMALTVAARHPNVYIETSSVPYEVLLKCVEAPELGPEKLIFGTDTPAFYGYYKSASTGEYYPSYGKTGPGDITPDHYPVDMGNIERLPITDVQRQMIMGGTIARLLAGKHE